MMSPLKLSVIVCGAAAGLAVAPYVVKQILPPEPVNSVIAAATDSGSEPTAIKLDLPIAGQNQAPAVQPVLALAAPAKEETSVQPELQLASALPVPVAVSSTPELSLPSLSSPAIASAALPVPAAATPASFSPPKPSPTPEIPFSTDVEVAQKLMKQLGLSTGKIDGKLGPNTQAAVREFQKKEGLEATGQVNSELLSKMEVAVAALPTPTPAPTATPEPKVVISDATDDSTKLSDAKDMEISSADEPDAIIVRKAEIAKKDTDVPAERKVLTATSRKPKIDPGPVPTLKNMEDVKKLQSQLQEAGTYTGKIDGKWGDLTRTAMRTFQEKVSIEVTGKPNKETWLAMHTYVPAAEEQTESSVHKPQKTEKALANTDGDDTIPSVADMGEDVLVTVNGDGSSNPGAPEPLATPSAVSSLDEEIESSKKPERSVSKSTDQPKVKVSAPSNSSKVDEDDNSDDEPNDLAVANEDRESQAAELEKEIKATRAKIQSVSSDSTYEIKKYAPKTLEAVNTMADGLRSESLGDNPEDTKERLARISEELEKAKQESAKKKASTLVAGVRDSYEALKANFPQRIKTLSLSDQEEKKQRETLTVFVADIDRGFEAMEGDFKKGKYEPIFENGKEFKNTIDEINRGLAEIYVREKLAEKNVKSKLDKDELEDIESLVKKSDHVKAAEKLDSVVSSGSKKKS